MSTAPLGIRDLATTGVRPGLEARRLLPVIGAGLVAGLLALSSAISYPAVIFTGPFEAYLGLGIAMALLGSVVLGTVVAIGSTYPPAIAKVQIETAVALGAIATALAPRFAAGPADPSAIATLIVTILLATMTLGLVFLVLGICRLGNTIRYIPYPVIGAFLAYIAWLLLQGGLIAMTGRQPALGDLAWLLERGTLLHWLPGLLGAAALAALQLGRRHVLNAPFVLILAIGAFWAVASMLGLPSAELRARGYLLAPLSSAEIISPRTLVAALDAVDWQLVAAETPKIVVVWLVALITLLISASSLEIATGADIDLNRELKVTGIANLVSGALGGLPGYQSVSASLLPHYLGTRSRLVGLICAAMCGAVLLLGGPLLAYVPKLLLGLVLIYLAFDIAAELALQRWPKLAPADRGILLLVLVSLIWFGFVQGIVIGLVAGLAMFAFSYARIDAVQAVGSRATYASNVVRPPEQLRWLATHAEAIQVIRLQGYLFFGSAHRMREQIAARLATPAPAPLRFLLLDFERVDGADSSTIFCLVRLVEQARQRGVTVVFAALPAILEAALRPPAAESGEGPEVLVAADLDHALEQAEEALLAAAGPGEAAGEEPATDELVRAIPDPALRAGILRYGEHVRWRAGDHVIRQGEQSDEMYFIEAGRLTARLDRPNGGHVRLRTILPGTVIGEVGCYLGQPRTASVVADQDGSAVRFSREAIERMRHERADLAAAFHAFMASATAERLAYNTSLLEARIR